MTHYETAFVFEAFVLNHVNKIVIKMKPKSVKDGEKEK